MKGTLEVIVTASTNCAFRSPSQFSLEKPLRN